MNTKSFLLHFFHFAIIVACWTSPFYLAWQIIFILIVFYYLQNIFLGGCVISKLQFGNNDETMYSYFLTKLKINYNKKKLRFITDHIFPWLILLIALWYQKIL